MEPAAPDHCGNSEVKGPDKVPVRVRLPPVPSRCAVQQGRRSHRWPDAGCRKHPVPDGEPRRFESFSVHAGPVRGDRVKWAPARSNREKSPPRFRSSGDRAVVS